MERTDSTPRRYRSALANRYRALFDEHGPPSAVEEEVTAGVTELELQSRWFAGEFGHRFTSTRGRSVEVIQFGTWNHAAGPDFTEVAVQIEGKRHSGCVELDRDVRDWEHHGHHESPHYTSVVLHVFFERGREQFFSRTVDHREVEQIHLSVKGPLEARKIGFEPEAKLGRCSAKLNEWTPKAVESLLEAAAQYRLDLKARRLQRVARLHGKSEALFQGTAEALGYRRNTFPMRVIAQRLPIQKLRRLSQSQQEALLFGIAGFLEGAYHVEIADDETRAYQRELWSTWWQEKSAWSQRHHRLPWSHFGIRPTNHPQRRLASLAALAREWSVFEEGVFATSINTKRIIRCLKTITSVYWNHHYTLKAPPVVRPFALIGQSRIREILANQILPLRFSEDPESVWNVYQQLGASNDNQKVRRAALRLLGRRPDAPLFLRKTWHQQALLQLYDDFCLVDQSGCETCPFPERLDEWAE